MSKFDFYLGEPFTLFGSAALYEEAKVIVFGVPFDSTSYFNTGSRFGPNAIREASDSIDPFDPLVGKESPVIHDIGNISPILGNAEKTVERVHEVEEIIKKDKKVPFMLGGEHTSTLGALKTFKDATLVMFDAHPDFYEEIMGADLFHGSFLRHALEFFPAENFISVFKYVVSWMSGHNNVFGRKVRRSC